MIASTGIDFSVIAPPAYLKHFVAQEPARVHHVAAQRVLSDEIYRGFFTREAERGAEIIVDNGLFDLGYALPHGKPRRSRAGGVREGDHPAGRHAGRGRDLEGEREGRARDPGAVRRCIPAVRGVARRGR